MSRPLRCRSLLPGVAVLVLASVVLGVAGAEPPLLADELAAVDRLLAGGAGGAALARIDRLLAVHGDDPLWGWQLRERRGLALVLDGRPQAALPLLEEAVQRRPLSPEGHRNLADALRRLGRRGRALSEYAQAVELAPRDGALRLEYAQFLAEFRQWRRAEVEFRTAAHLGAGEAADRGLAVALLRQGRPQDAVPPLRRLHAATPTAASRRELAAALQAAARDSELVALLAEVPRDSLDRTEHRALLQAEGTLGGPPVHARALVRSLAAADPPRAAADDALVWAWAGLNLLAAGENADALAATTRAVELAPENLTYRNNRLVALQRLGRVQEAARERAEIRRREDRGKEPR